PVVDAARAPKSQRPRGVPRLQRATEGQAHEARVVLFVSGHERARATELETVSALSRPAVTPDERAVEIEHPLPDETVQIVHAPIVRRPLTDRRKIGGRGLRVPGEDPFSKTRLAGTVGALVSRARGKLPFGLGRKALTASLTIGLRREPAHARHGL